MMAASHGGVCVKTSSTANTAAKSPTRITLYNNHGFTRQV